MRLFLPLLTVGIIQGMSTKGQFPFPVNEVEKCPTDQSEYDNSNARLNCKNDTNGSPSYICIPNSEKSSLLEFCYPHTVERFQKGNCIVLSTSGYIENYNCSRFKSGCPEDTYIGNNFFKYPKCQDIIKDRHCYKADSTCRTTTTEPKDRGKYTEKDDSIAIIISIVCAPFIILSMILILVSCRKSRTNTSHQTYSTQSENSDKGTVTIFNGYDIRYSRKTDSDCSYTCNIPNLCFVSPEPRVYMDWKTEDIKYMNYFVLMHANQDKSLAVEDINPKLFIKKLVGKHCSGLPIDFLGFKEKCLRNENVRFCVNDNIFTRIPIGFRSHEEEYESLCVFIQDQLCHNDIFDGIRVVLENAAKVTVAKYFRTSGYKPRSGEKCILIPPSLNDEFIDKFKIHILLHDTLLKDKSIHQRISEKVLIPEEILSWESKPRKRFLEQFLKGTKTFNRASCFIVGCSSAGKTTLLKRLKHEDIENVQSTRGVDIHNEIFLVNTITETIEVMTENIYDNIGSKSLSMADFAGQCAYYACHQIYLRGAAFYILVTDMTKELEMKVGREQCQQDGTIFSDWTYKDYFEFWLRSLHIYCDKNTPVIVVATHRDKANPETLQKPFFDKLLESLPEKLDLKMHLDYKRYFSIGLGIEDDIERLKSCIVKLATELPIWIKQIPATWEELESLVLKQTAKIMHKSELQSSGILPPDCVDDFLLLYHDTGRILNFNEGKLAETIILDIQWFVDAFKLIISDKNHVKQQALYTSEWRDFNYTGELNDNYLERIWVRNNSYMQNKDELLDYMQRLGLIAKGSTSHYVPCMNKKNYDDHERLTLRNCSYKSSILMFRFDFLPYFIFCRLVVACMCAGGAWKTLLDEQNERRALYKNTAMFNFEENIVVLSVTDECILAQVFVRGKNKLRIVNQSIRHSLIDMLRKVTGTFHKNLNYEIGFGCRKELVGEYPPEKVGFVPESELKKKSKIPCPYHQRSGYHKIDTHELLGHWNSKYFRKGSRWTKGLIFWGRQNNSENGSTSEMSEINESRGDIDAGGHGAQIENTDVKSEKNYQKIFIKLTAISRDALQIYFDSKFPPRDLQKVLTTYKDDLKKGQFKFVDEQLSILYPGDGSCPSSTTFDVTIMYKLLRNYGDGLPVPSQGWGKKPEMGNIQETDDVERIRIYRNKFCHASPKTHVMEKDEFEMYWMDLSKAIMRISQGTLNAAVNQIVGKQVHLHV